MYCVPVAPAWVAGVAIVCVDPAVHCGEQGDVQAVPSMVRASPAGLVAMVSVNTAAKLAATVTGAFMVTFCGVVVPLNPLENPLKRFPALADALTETTEPALYQPLAGLMLPPAPALVVR